MRKTSPLIDGQDGADTWAMAKVLLVMVPPLTGSRTTAAVAGIAPPGTPAGTALLDDVSLSNAGLREDSGVLVAPVTVYGARSVTLSGSALTTRSVPSATLRQALLGKVLTVGDTVSLLPRDLGPGTSTSEASSALTADRRSARGLMSTASTSAYGWARATTSAPTPAPQPMSTARRTGSERCCTCASIICAKR